MADSTSQSCSSVSSMDNSRHSSPPSSASPTIYDHDESHLEQGAVNTGMSLSPKSKVEPHEDYSEDPFLVTLDAAESPKQFGNIRKWIATLVICSAATCVTCASSVVRTSASSIEDVLMTDGNAYRLLLRKNPCNKNSMFPLPSRYSAFHSLWKVWALAL